MLADRRVLKGGWLYELISVLKNETHCPLTYCLHGNIFTLIMDRKKILKKFGDQVKFKRVELKLTQGELADRCGFDRTYISLIERGLRNISFTNLLILAKGLDITISSLTKDL